MKTEENQESDLTCEECGTPLLRYGKGDVSGYCCDTCGWSQDGVTATLDTEQQS